jgi:hypothetical protein
MILNLIRLTGILQIQSQKKGAIDFEGFSFEFNPLSGSRISEGDRLDGVASLLRLRVKTPTLQGNSIGEAMRANNGLVGRFITIASFEVDQPRVPLISELLNTSRYTIRSSRSGGTDAEFTLSSRSQPLIDWVGI